MGIFNYNYLGVNNLTADILSTIKNAKRYVKVCAFLMHEKEVKDLLIKRAGNISVFILSNRQSDEVFDFYEEGPEEIKIQTSNLLDLELAGAHVKFINGLHAKFVIADGESGWITSANMNSNSLHANIETGVRLEGQNLAELESVFDHLFCNADGHLDIMKETLAFNSNVCPLDNSFVQCFSGRLRITLSYNLPENDSSVPVGVLRNCKVTTLYNEILRIINNATSKLTIVTWHFNLFSKYKMKEGTQKEGSDKLEGFINAVKSARDRGVEIDTFSDPIGYEGSTRRSLISEEYLRDQLGCRIYHVRKNHSKCVVNEREGLMLTGNIDCMRSMEHGFEVGYLLDNQQLDLQRGLILRMLREAEAYL